MTIDTDEQPRRPLLDHEWLVTDVLERDRTEPVEHPRHRRSSLLPPRRIDRPGDEQAVDRPRHGHVVQAEQLRLLGCLLGRAHGLVVERATALPGRRVQHLEAEEPVGAADDLLSARRRSVAPRVRDDDDAELEALCRMDREQPNGVAPFLLGERLRLVCAGGLPLEDKADEPLDVAAAKGLVRAREPPELPEVRVATAPVVPCEHREVVVVLRDDLIDQPLEPGRGRERDEAFVPLPERAEELLVA